MKFKKIIVVLLFVFIALSRNIVMAVENNNLNIYSNAVILIDNTTRKNSIRKKF